RTLIELSSVELNVRPRLVSLECFGAPFLCQRRKSIVGILQIKLRILAIENLLACQSCYQPCPPIGFHHSAIGKKALRFPGALNCALSVAGHQRRFGQSELGLST